MEILALSVAGELGLDQTRDVPKSGAKTCLLLTEPSTQTLPKEVPVEGLEAADLPEAHPTLAHPRGTRSCAEVFFQGERMGKSIVVKARKGRGPRRNPSGMLVAIFEDRKPINNFAFGRDQASVVCCVAKKQRNFATCRLT